MSLTPPKTKFATLNTAGLKADFDRQFLVVGDRTNFLGNWEFGTAPSMPDFVDASEGMDVLKVRDKIKADGLAMTLPASCLCIFKSARENNLFISQEVHRLAGLGYSPAATADALRSTHKAKPATDELLSLGVALAGERTRLIELENFTRSTFHKREEGPDREMAYDLALAGKAIVLTAPERAMLANGAVPERFDDDRTMAALHRLPPALHGLPAADLERLRKNYAAQAWPNCTAAIALGHEMVNAAAAALASAAVTLEVSLCEPTGAIVGKLPDFVARHRWLVTMGKEEAAAARGEGMVKVSEFKDFV